MGLGIGIGVSMMLINKATGAIPPPPYAVFSQDGITTFTSITGLDYVEGSGPSAESALFGLYWDNLSPSSGDITITPSGANFEIYNPDDATWYSTAFNIAYVLATSSLSGFKVRAKAGLSDGSISGTFTVTAPNTNPFVLSCSGEVAAMPINYDFTITVKTDNAGFTASNQFKLPLMPGATYNALIEWGDGTTTTQTTDVKPTHTYPSPGTYQIKISGVFPSIAFGFGAAQNDPLKLLSIDNWGTIVWGNFSNAFRDCSNMVANYTDAPNLTNVTSLSTSFSGCTLFNGDVSGFNTINVTDFSFMFYLCSSFNQEVTFNFSNALTLSNMFGGCTAFNQPVNFDTSSVTEIQGLFGGCTLFNQPVNFNTSLCQYFDGFFQGCINFNQPVNFDTSNATSLSLMFDGCTLFNQPVNFDTSSVENFYGMFKNCTAFNQPVNFNTSLSIDFTEMFSGCTVFNQSVNFNTPLADSLFEMFKNCTAFNQPVSSFLVSNVTIFDDFMLGKTFNDYNAAYLDDIYNTWTNNLVTTAKNISFGTIKRTAASTAARALLTSATATRIVTACVNNGVGLIRITTSAVHGRTTGNKVFISGITGCVEANGGWIVTVISTTVIDLQGSAFVNPRISGGSVKTGYSWTITDGGI